ncbi:DUF5359 family protein [Bacillus coahuilensis]|nr:DUF5359 family protein [Bacillus coahuilensis]
MKNFERMLIKIVIVQFFLLLFVQFFLLQRDELSTLQKLRIMKVCLITT